MPYSTSLVPGQLVRESSHKYSTCSLEAVLSSLRTTTFLNCEISIVGANQGERKERREGVGARGGGRKKRERKGEKKARIN